MENLVNESDIKQDDDDANIEMYSTKIIAAKIYSIAGLMDNADADISQEYGGVHQEKSGEEENVYDNLFEVKEEDLELISSYNLESDDNVQPTHDSASAIMPFRVHIAQNHKSKEAKSELQYSLLCPFCGSEFSDHPEWRHHLNVVHKFNKRESLNMLYTNDTTSCLERKVEMKSKHIWNLQRHRIVHLPYNRYVKCKLCNKCFQTDAYHKKHINRCHNEKRNDPNMVVLCPFCGKKFPDSIEWRVHLNTIHEFNKRETLNMDLTNDKSKSQECNIELKSNFTCQLQQHRILHLPYKRFVKCKLCEELFDNTFRYRFHIVRCKRK